MKAEARSEGLGHLEEWGGGQKTAWVTEVTLLAWLHRGEGHCREMTPLTALLLLTPLAHGATLVVLDNSNGYSFVLEPGVTLSRPLQTRGDIQVVGGTTALGTADVALLPGTATGLQGIISGGATLAAGEIFTITATASGNLYEAELLFFARPNVSDVGTDPDVSGSLATGAAFSITTVPEPSAALLLLLSGAMLAKRRR